MSKVAEKEYTITTKDGYPLAATIFSTSRNCDRVIVMASGVGVPRYIYSKFARYLASQGFKVITFDYRGIHESNDPGFEPSEMKMEEWGRQDIEAVLQFALKDLQAKKLFFIGHSGGGQLVSLAPSSKEIDVMVFLSVTLGHWRYWPGIWKWGLFLFWHLMPLITWRRDFFPAKLFGFSSIDIPSGVTRQWAWWGRSPNYLFDHIDCEDRMRYASLDMPLLSLSFDDDSRLGPKRAVDKILTYFENVHLTRKHIQPEEYGKSNIGHFGFFKDEFKPSLWYEVLEWMESSWPQ